MVRRITFVCALSVLSLQLFARPDKAALNATIEKVIARISRLVWDYYTNK